MHKKESDAMFFLKEKALDAHRTGKGFLVMHLCQIAIEYLKKSNDKNVFDSAHWCIALYLYWYIGKPQFFEPYKLISSENNIHTLYFKFTEWLETLINDSKFTAMPILDNYFYDYISDREEDICLFEYAIELIFVFHPLENHWIDVSTDILSKAVGNSKLHKVISSLRMRLACQSEIFWNKKVNITYNQDDFELVEGYKFLKKCEWEKLTGFLDKCSSNISCDSPKYLPLVQLALFSDAYREKTESRALNWTKYELAEATTTNQVLYVLKMKARLSESYNLYLKQNNSTAPPIVAYALMIFSLRNWTGNDFYSSLRMLKDYYLSYFSDDKNETDKNEVVKKVIFYSLKSCSINIREQEMLNVLYSFDKLSEPERSETIDYILSCSNAELYHAHEIISIISDAIPYRMLPKLVKWSVKLEGIKNTRGWKITYLEFWTEILKTINKKSDAGNLIEELMPAINKSIGHHVLLNNLSEFYVLCILKSKTKTSENLIDLLISQVLAEHNTKERWNIIFDASRKSKRIWNKYAKWIEDNSKLSTISKWNYSRYIDDLQQNEADTTALKLRIIKDTSGIIDTILTSDIRQNIELGKLYSSRLLRIVNWEQKDLQFVNKLLQAISSEKFIGNEVATFLLYLAEIYHTKTVSIKLQIKKALQKILALKQNNHNFSEFLNTDEFDRAKLYLCYNIITSSGCGYDKNIVITILQYIAALDTAEHKEDYDFLFIINMYLSFMAKDGAEQWALAAKADCYMAILTGNESKNISTLIKMIHSFNSIIRVPRFKYDIVRLKNKKLKEHIMKTWEKYLIRYSKNLNPAIRVEVAKTLIKWRKYMILFPDSLNDVLETLKNDPRMTVSNACHQSKY